MELAYFEGLSQTEISERTGDPLGHGQDQDPAGIDKFTKGVAGMNDGMHISQEDLALYAMQALDGEELNALRAHLPTCVQCREQLQIIAGDLTAVGLSVEQHPVPEAARQRFMESIATDSPMQTTIPIAVTPEPARKRASGISWVPWAIGSCAGHCRSRVRA